MCLSHKAIGRLFSYVTLTFFSLITCHIVKGYQVWGIRTDNLGAPQGAMAIEQETMEFEGFSSMDSIISELINQGKAQMSLGEVESVEILDFSEDRYCDYNTDDDLAGTSDPADEAKKYLMESYSWIEDVKNYSRSGQNMPPYSYTRNYFIEEGLTDNQLISFRLAKDARIIHESEPDGGMHLTVLCVALRDQFGHIKKFAFSNADYMERTCRAKATELGYDVIKAEQAHAEGQFLQFLYKRNRTQPGLYTHIVGMGCSRLHCLECNSMLQLILGNRYHELSAAVKTTKRDKVMEVSEHSSNFPDGFILARVRSDDEVNCTVVMHSGEVVEDKKYKNFYIPRGLKDLIQSKVNCPIKISGKRYER